MKKIILPIAVMLLLYACTKPLAVMPDQSQPAVNTDRSLAASVPCTGNTWTAITDWPMSSALDSPHYLGIRFVCNNKLYIPVYGKKMFIYDGSTWTSIHTNFPDDDLSYSYSFSVGEKGYLVINSASPAKLWRYDPVANNWTVKTAFSGPKRIHPASFVIGTKAYITCGTYYGNYLKDLWEYNSVTDQWSQKPDMPASIPGRTNATAFSIGSNGYITGGGRGGSFTGMSNIFYNSLVSYNQVLNSWTVLANYPGILGDDGSSFSIGNYGYAGLDRHSLYRYSPSSNSWAIMASYPGPEYRLNGGISFNNRGYIAYSNDMYKYTPVICGIGGTTP